MKYPADIVNDDGWSRIHQGHDLDRAALEYDLREHWHARPDGAELHIEEVHFRYSPRVKWCGRHDWPCDQEGDWHGHWYAVKPSDTSKFTIASWRVPAHV